LRKSGQTHDQTLRTTAWHGQNAVSGFFATNFRDLRKQDVGLSLMISLSLIMYNVLPHRSPQGTFTKENKL